MGRFDIPDHPEIGWIERTGYPSWMQEPDEEEDDCFYEERREQELFGDY